jgi:ubiquinol-cytochrome c reductase iron-sulfur subunit
LSITQSPEEPPGEEQRKAERQIAVWFAVSALAGLALFGVYIAGGQTQIEGVLLMLALGGLGIGIAIWGEKLLDAREVAEDRHELTSGAAGRKAFETSLAEEAGSNLKRRSFLVKMLIAAGGALGLAAVLPAISLGPAPGRSLKETAWRNGTRLVREGGEPIRAEDLEVDQVISVLPEGHLRAADSITLLLRVRNGELQLPPERLEATVDGIVAYSKICTHVGCPVALYEQQTHHLLCPCHQSTFDVADGAKVVFGPAKRPLPQLPITVDDEGYLIAQSDFTEPVGPSYWERLAR